MSEQIASSIGHLVDTSAGLGGSKSLGNDEVDDKDEKGEQDENDEGGEHEEDEKGDDGEDESYPEHKDSSRDFKEREVLRRDLLGKGMEQ
ncbi:hypothetical protein AgCh_022174 [Apium graveolens]